MSPDELSPEHQHPAVTQEALKSQGRRFDLVVSSIENLKEAVMERAIGSDTYQAAEEQREIKMDAIRNLDQDLAERYAAEPAKIIERYGEEIDDDSDLGLLGVAMIKLGRHEHQFLQGGRINSEGSWLKTDEEMYFPAGQDPRIRYDIVRLRNDQLVVEHYDHPLGARKLHQERAEATAQELSLENATKYAELVENYRADLVRLSQLDQAELRAELGMTGETNGENGDH